MDLFVYNDKPVIIPLQKFIKTWTNKPEFIKLRNSGKGVIARGEKSPQQYYEEALQKYNQRAEKGELTMFDRKPSSPKEFMEEQLVDNYTINDPKNIKSARSITYDDDGKIIPLSKRDNFNINDIRYMLPLPILGILNK